MQALELRAKTDEQLQAMIIDFKKESMNLRFQLQQGSLANTSRIKFVRKMIAKIKTIVNNERLKNKRDINA
jgi:large subunit ribosomal protein L29